jgi:hypothetical protein
MKALIDFFKGVVELLNVQTKSSSEEDENSSQTEKVTDSYKWLIEETSGGKSTRAQVNEDVWFKPGKIYIFKYDAKYKNFLDYWDRHPIVLALGKRQLDSGSIVNVGINISWYPPFARNEIIKRIQKMYEPQFKNAIKKKPKNANEQQPIIIDLYRMKLALDPLGLSWAIRNYLPDRILQPKICICYEDWDKAIKLDQPKIYPEIQGKTSLSQVYDSFKRYVLDRNNRLAEYRKRTEEAKKQNKYTFIK